MSTTRLVQTEILQAIQIMLDKTVEKLAIPKEYTSVVEAVNADGTYRVSINGASYDLKCGWGGTLTVGTSVWVHVNNPTRVSSTSYICALR